MPISEIVQVNIAVQDAAIAQAAFNKILLAGYHTVGPELIRDYTSLTSIETDFASWPGILAGARAFFAQNPHPVTLAIGRMTSAHVKTFVFTPTVANSRTYSIVVNGTTYSYTSDTAATAQEIVEGLKAAYDLAAVAGVTATEDNATLTLTGTSGLWFEASSGNSLLAVEETTNVADTIDAELTAIAAERDDWYGVVHVDHSSEVLERIGAWVPSKRKVYGTSSLDSDVVGSGTSDPASILETASNNRTFVTWNQNPGDFPEMASLAGQFPFTPGSRTYAFKQLTGISHSSAFLSGSQVTNLNNKNANWVREIGGFPIFYPGKMASGRFIDVQTGIDWLTARMEERIFARLVNAAKIPYTDEGLTILEGEVPAQLQEAIREGVVANDDNLSVTVLSAANQAANDRAARIVRGLKFTARLAGAVHSVIVEGVVTV